jgi:hypothetical protein
LPVLTGAPKFETNQETQNQTSKSAKGSFRIFVLFDHSNLF